MGLTVMGKNAMGECLSIKNLWNRFCPFRFVVVGLWNTVFSYLVFSGLYYRFGGGFGDVLVQAVAGVIGITHAYVMHRLLTYRSNGVWWKEYFRFYIVYGGQVILQATLFFVFSTWLGGNGYSVQFVSMALLTVVSYWAHRNYSFASKFEKRGEEL